MADTQTEEGDPTIASPSAVPGALYYIGRGLQLLGMGLLLEAILIAGPMGPSPRIFGAGIAVFVVGWLVVRQRVGRS